MNSNLLSILCVVKKVTKCTDELCADDIYKDIRYKDYRPVVFSEIDSTNLELKRQVAGGEVNDRLIVADRQTMGRGRLGRSFESPAQSGIYMSLLLPIEDSGSLLLITSAAAVAVCRAVKSVCDIDSLIKWVNDIFVNGKKVCGILAEAVSGCDGKLNVVLGIGINVATDKSRFTDNVRNVAGALYDKLPDNVTRNSLAASVVNEFMDIFVHITDRQYLNDYRQFSMVIGKNIRYRAGDEWHTGKAVDIDDNGGLVVVTSDETVTLNTGEISVRLESD